MHRRHGPFGNFDFSLPLLTERLGYSSSKWRRYGKKSICLSRIYRQVGAMTLCFELQQSHEMDYAMKFAQDIWQIRTLHGNGVTWDVYIK